MELRIRGEHAVLAAQDGTAGREIDPRSLALEAGLAEALHEWARVAAAVNRDEEGPHGDGDQDRRQGSQAAAVVSRRGRQLAARLASTMGRPVSYRDPVTGLATVIPPSLRDYSGPRRPRRSPLRRLIGGTTEVNEPTPWGTGLTAAAFIAVVVAVAMLALADTLATETSGILAIVAAIVVTSGLAPSLWLARHQPVLRWVALGAGTGVAVSWIGVLALAL